MSRVLKTDVCSPSGTPTPLPPPSPPPQSLVNYAESTNQFKNRHDQLFTHGVQISRVSTSGHSGNFGYIQFSETVLTLKGWNFTHS